jgi:branched-chain amino acid transport system permease protein
VLISLLDSYLAQAENGLHLGFFKLTLPAGAADGILGVLMVLMLILRPRGLTGGREWDLSPPRFLRRARRRSTTPSGVAEPAQASDVDHVPAVTSVEPDR